MLGGFFGFWKANRFKMLAEGFTVTKSEKTGKWYLTETKPTVALFKIFKDKPPKPEDKFALPSYTIKDPSGLRTWQVDAAGKLCAAVNHWGAAIDGSDTGTGKTYTACAVARELDLNLCIVCPKAVIKPWTKVIKNHFKMGSKLVGVINYEKLSRGRRDSSIASFVLHKHKKRPTFEWKIPKRTLIVWDESQKLKNWKTKNSKTCQAAIKAGFPMLFCSATNATNPLEMRAVGLALKIYEGSQSYYSWAYENGVYKGNWGLEFNNDPKILKVLHHQIFNQRGVRLRRDEIPNFPQCEIIPEVYNMEEEDALKINEVYTDMERELAKLAKASKHDAMAEAVAQLRMRQKVELIKVPLFVDMAEEAMEEGMSVVIFVNFTDTLNAIAARLKTTCIFDGKTADNVRDRNVELFQEDKERVILVNIQSGGAGLSLHDLNGKFPRMSIVSPTWSPVLIRQALGRIWRDDAKTKCVQRIVCVANTVEEDVCRNVQQKLNNLDMLNDGDLAYGKNYEIISD
jgi:superfamily II DNA or RNA helicase